MALQTLGGKEFDIEVVDIHHKSKQDDPSGTALMIEEALLDSNNHTTKITPKVHFTSIRGGQVVGEHRIMFLGNQEEITISHKVTDRSPFAKGALNAAKWLAKQSPGRLYKIQDIF